MLPLNTPQSGTLRDVCFGIISVSDFFLHIFFGKELCFSKLKSCLPQVLLHPSYLFPANSLVCFLVLIVIA